MREFERQRHSHYSDRERYPRVVEVKGFEYDEVAGERCKNQVQVVKRSSGTGSFVPDPMALLPPS